MTVSIIVPTYNGAQKISNVLQALSQQSSKDFEVVVVNDGSTDNTIDVLYKVDHEFKKFKIIDQPNKGRAAVRNRGAAEAEGNLLIFFDDDMRPAPECVATHIKHHLLHPGSIMTGAAIEQVIEGSSDMLSFKAFLSNKWNAGFRNQYFKPLSSDKVFVTAANFSVSRETFMQLGGFDERLIDSEDFDLAVRAFKASIPLYVNLEAHAWHDDNITCAAYIKRLRQYNEANKKLSLLKPELFVQYRYVTPKLKGIKRLAFATFAYAFWINLVDKNCFRKILPKKLRFKLYDYIVTANGVYFPDKVSL